MSFIQAVRSLLYLLMVAIPLVRRRPLEILELEDWRRDVGEDDKTHSEKTCSFHSSSLSPITPEPL